jgi:hypothetical protein
MRLALLIVLLQLCGMYRYSTRSTECALSAVRTEIEPSPALGNLLVWKSTFRYCGYIREVRYVDQTILKSYNAPSRLTLYHSVLGTSERDWFLLQILVEWILLGTLALGYVMYQDGISLFVLWTMARQVSEHIKVN